MKGLNKMKNCNTRMSLALTDETKDKFNKLFNKYKCIYPNNTHNAFLNDLLNKYDDNEFKRKLLNEVGIQVTPPSPLSNTPRPDITP